MLSGKQVADDLPFGINAESPGREAAEKTTNIRCGTTTLRYNCRQTTPFTRFGIHRSRKLRDICSLQWHKYLAYEQSWHKHLAYEKNQGQQVTAASLGVGVGVGIGMAGFQPSLLMPPAGSV